MKSMLAAAAAAVDTRVAALVAGDAAERIWRHDATFWGGDAERLKSVSNRLGWLEVAATMLRNAPEIERFAEQVRADGFTDAVLCGMGGSSLAPEVLRLSIGRRDGYAALHVLDTTDPATIGAVVNQIDVSKTLVFVSSKSGTTIEANSLFAYFHELVQARKGDRAGENFVAITDVGTPLQDLALQYKFRHVFTNPSDIGGRYSALSYFGLVPAAVTGIDVTKLLERGVAAAQETTSPESDAMRLGVALAELAIAGRNKCTFIVSPKVAPFGLWVEQLIAESTGKLGKGILPVAGEPLGAPAAYGDDRLFVRLRLDGDDNATQDAAVDALITAGFPVISIDLGDTYDLGREFFRWEFAIAVAGQVLGINPFDEPNVQESKDNTTRVLSAFQSDGGFGTPEEVELGASDARSSLSALLAAVAKNDYFAITAYVPAAPAAEQALASIRTQVRDRRGVATTLGYGPRFLHSTGQLHKGGPPQGVFLQLTVEDAGDIAIPGRAFTFGQLKRAQAIGDLQSLRQHGRPALSIRLPKDARESEFKRLAELITGALAATAATR